MILTTVLSFAALACNGAPAADPVSNAPATPDVTVKWDSPKAFLEGASFLAHVELTASKDGGSIPSWALSSAAFTVDGKPLGTERGNAKIELAPDQKIVTDIDLAPSLAKAKTDGMKPFKLGFASQVAESPEVAVNNLVAAEAGLDFMKMDAADLAKFHVYMVTNRGAMEMEFWPDVAPNHVRNFLDLSYTGFYNGLTFHRVIPGFMIQGGDPTGTGSGNGPRTLKAEFSKDAAHKHVPGVLSMARSASPDSASSQFFVMHGTAPSLDGQYSAFGKLVSGLEVVNKIVTTPRNPSDKPNEPQAIVKAIVVRVAK